MTSKKKKSLKQWVDLLAIQELPAITSIACTLDKFSNDDVSSIPSLSKAILHDQALSTSLLKVVNNMPRSTGNKVNTISRGATILGIQAVKNICMTSKILDGMLDCKDLTKIVHHRLTKLMANSFYAGLLAKMMLPNHTDEIQEEVYLAAMLYHIGETAFWSLPSPEAKNLVKHFYLPEAKFQKKCQEELGFTFSELSIGLTEAWKLSELMAKSQDRPESRTVEIQTIFLSNELSTAIATPPETKSEFDNILKHISRIMKVDMLELHNQIQETQLLATNLVKSYGAKILEKHIKEIPLKSDFKDAEDENPYFGISKEKAILTSINTLNKLTCKSNNINNFLNYALQQIAQVIGFDRASFWIINKNKGVVQARSTFDKKGHAETFNRVLPYQDCVNVISHVIEIDRPVLVNEYKSDKWCHYMSEELEVLIASGVICFSTVKIEGRVIGIISAQRLTSREKISEDDFLLFTHLVEHLNLCLSLISYHK
jgi:HD-like signal output (HDOD) protein